MLAELEGRTLDRRNDVKRNTAAQPDPRKMVRELGIIFEQLRRHERADHVENSEQSRTQLGDFKRGAVERVNNLMPAIWNYVLDGSLRDPDILDRFNGLAFSVPDPRQTSLTWRPYLARLRQVLLLAMGDDASAASISRKLDSPAEGPATIAILDADTERAVLGPSGLHRTAAQQTNDLTCKDLAQQWSLGQSTIRRIFRDEPGVLRIAHSRRRGKRDYISLRIPAAVAARVRARMSRPLFKVE